MYRKALLVVLQTLLFLFLLAAGAFLPALPMFQSMYWQVQTSATHVLVLDGFVLALAVYGVILGVEAATRRLRGAGALTTLALALALALSFAMRIGFKSV